MTSDLGIVIPAYEPDAQLLASYVHALSNRLNPETIGIELDAPGGTVPEELRNCSASVNVATHRRGKGAAITAGFEALETNVLAFADADGSTPASSVENVVYPVRTGAAALSVGSRRHPDSIISVSQSMPRKYLGSAFVGLAQRLLPVSLSDYQCGAKAIAADAWVDVRPHLREVGFAWDVELVALVAALDRRIVEMPVEWEDRPGSTVDPIDDGIDMFRALCRIHHRTERLCGSRLHRAVDMDADPPLIDRIRPPEAVSADA